MESGEVRGFDKALFELNSVVNGHSAFEYRLSGTGKAKGPQGLLRKAMAFKQLASLRTHQEAEKIPGGLLILAALHDSTSLPDWTVQIGWQ